MPQAGYAKKLEPSPKDIRTVYWLSRGFTAAETAQKQRVTTFAIHKRLKELYKMTGAQNKNHLVYWMLDKDLIDYPLHRGPKRQKPTPAQLEVVELIIQGYTRENVARKLYLTREGVDRRITVACRKLGCKNTAQLIAVCWQENWIV